MTAPENARQRTDLPFLRRRRRQVKAAVVPVDTVHPKRRRVPPQPAAGPAPHRPAAGAGPHRPAQAANPLDLASPPEPASFVPRALVRTPLPRSSGAVRARSGTPILLTSTAPTVTLTRIQSGVGVLTVEAACAESVGDLRLGCAYRLRSGHTSVVQHSRGTSSGPPGSPRPVIVAERRQYERLVVDLAQAREIDRLLIYAYPGGDAPVHWGGTLIVTTFGQASVKVPLDRPASRHTLVIASLYNVHGEFVVRAEMDEVAGPAREACLAFGYDRIAWLDADTPLT